MARQDVLEKVVQADDPAEFRELQSHLPEQWIHDALRTTNRGSVRQRRLPAFATAWVVIAMGLFRDRAIDEVVAHLGLANRSKSCARTESPVIGSGVIAEARKRLGAEPMKDLFYRIVDERSAHATAGERCEASCPMVSMASSSE